MTDVQIKVPGVNFHHLGNKWGGRKYYNCKVRRGSPCVLIVIRARVRIVPKRRSVFRLGEADGANFEAELLVVSANIVRSKILKRVLEIFN